MPFTQSSSFPFSTEHVSAFASPLNISVQTGDSECSLLHAVTAWNARWWGWECSCLAVWWWAPWQLLHAHQPPQADRWNHCEVEQAPDRHVFKTMIPRRVYALGRAISKVFSTVGLHYWTSGGTTLGIVRHRQVILSRGMIKNLHHEYKMLRIE